jgi:hypothetical protein
MLQLLNKNAAANAKPNKLLETVWKRGATPVSKKINFFLLKINLFLCFWIILIY